MLQLLIIGVVKISISTADILADPIIGTPLMLLFSLQDMYLGIHFNLNIHMHLATRSNAQFALGYCSQVMFQYS